MKKMRGEPKEIVLTLQAEHHPAWMDEVQFRLVISEATERIRTFVLSEMVPWRDRAPGEEMLPPGVEVWVERSRGLMSSLVLKRSNEGEPYIECYQLVTAGEGEGGCGGYCLTIEQGDYLKGLGASEKK